MGESGQGQRRGSQLIPQRSIRPIKKMPLCCAVFLWRFATNLLPFELKSKNNNGGDDE